MTAPMLERLLALRHAVATASPAPARRPPPFALREAMTARQDALRVAIADLDLPPDAERVLRAVVACAALRAKAVADILGCHPTSLAFRLLRAGLPSLRVLQMHVRRDLAAALLARGARLQAVAYLLGYDGHSVLNRAFRAEWGCLPRTLADADPATLFPAFVRAEAARWQAFRLPSRGTR